MSFFRSMSSQNEMNRKLSVNLQIPIIAAAICLVSLVAGECFGQNSSLFGQRSQRQPLTLQDMSWTYQKIAEQRPLALNDQVTVFVDAKSVFINDGQMDRKKNGYGSLTLPNWILFKGVGIIPDPQSAGTPKVRGEVDNKLRSQANLETRESMQFKIACKVVDIRPNGILVIEGNNSIRNNDEVSDYSLTGEIRAEDVKPDNTVLSANIANLRIDKREAGHVRDGYRRGWLLKWMDKYQPF